MNDGFVQGAEFAELVRGYVARAVEAATAPLLERIAGLEAQALAIPTAEILAELEANAVRAAGSAARAAAELAIAGLPADPPDIDAAVARYLAVNPPPAGADGVGLADALIDREGRLVITTTAGETKALGVVVGKDAEMPPPEPAPERSIEERAALAAMFLQKELGEAPLIDLPPPPPVRQTRASEPPINIAVTNHIPRKGAERTTVTKHDERGRIIEFERQEIED